MSVSAGLLGVGSYLPDEIRRNDWWSKDIVATWEDRARNVVNTEGLSESKLSHGARLTMVALAALRDDPFQGARERRVMPQDDLVSDMEVEAARQAIQRAGIDPAEVDCLLQSTTTPDFLAVNNACLLHHKLGLSS